MFSINSVAGLFGLGKISKIKIFRNQLWSRKYFFQFLGVVSGLVNIFRKF